MKPLNRADQTNAFLRFLFLFIVTVALIVTVVFFSIQVPWKENDSLRHNLTRLKNEKTATEKFNTTVREVVDEINGFEARKVPALVTRQQVELGIEKLNRQLKDLPEGENSVNALVVQSLDALNKAKYALNAKAE